MTKSIEKTSYIAGDFFLITAAGGKRLRAMVLNFAGLNVNGDELYNVRLPYGGDMITSILFMDTQPPAAH